MSWRLLAGGVISALATIAVVGSFLLGGDQPLTIEAGEDEVAALVAAPCPVEYEVLRAGRFDDAELARARDGVFVINGQEIKLEGEVDWTMNPQEARSFSHNLFKFQWIDPLLFAYRERGDTGALAMARDLVLDFARANPPDGDPVDPDVWDDKRTGDRGPYLAFIMRASECEGLLEPDQRELLLDLMGRHIEVLTDPEIYKPTNHGLFVDLGLTLFARQLDFLPQSEQWAALGRDRFEGTLEGRTVAEEGFWLEHSAGYQLLIAKTLTRFLEVPGNDTPELVELLRKMQDVVGWLRQPDGYIPQFGDSDRKQVPAFGDLRARDDRGILELDDSGLAVVKRDDSYLAVLASYFSDSHKHADALTFDLYDAGRRLITDTGLYHKDKDENFAFAHSSRAHSVLTVDGEDFPRNGEGAYGSGIVQTGKGHGYSAILGTNPATLEQGVDHRRLFVYEPGRGLVIIDRVRAEEKHRYARFLQFAPGVKVSKGRGVLELGASGFKGRVSTNGVGGERTELARGERDPLRGLTSPSFRKWEPRTTARLRSSGEDLNMITSISINGKPLSASLVSWKKDRIRLDLFSGGRIEQRLALVERGDDFDIDLVPRPGR